MEPITEEWFYLTRGRKSRGATDSESVNLDICFLGKPVFNQELLHLVALVALKLKDVASVDGVSNDSTVAAVRLRNS